MTFPDNPNTGDSRVFQTPNLYLEFDDQNASQSISRILMHPTDGVFYYLSDSSTEDGWTQFAHEASLGIDSEMSYLDGNSTFERKARVIVQNFRNNFAANAFASLEINGSVVSNALEIVHDFAENQMVVTGNGVPNYTPTVMGIEVTEGWNACLLYTSPSPRD